MTGGDRNFFGLTAVCVVVATDVTLICGWGWVWGLVKPWLHGVTA